MNNVINNEQPKFNTPEWFAKKRRKRILHGHSSSYIQTQVLLNDDGQPILNDDGSFILADD